MAKKKKAKTAKKVSKKPIIKKSKAKKKIAKKANSKKTKSKKKVSTITVAKKSTKKIVKKTASASKVKKKLTSTVQTNTKEALKNETKAPAEVKPKKKVRKKRITKAETLRLMQQEQLVKKWEALVKQVEQIETTKYNMNNIYEPETAINHKTLGWGFILSNTNDRLEVLFENGIKNLISNYKSR